MKFRSLWLFPWLIIGVAHGATANKIDPSDPNIWREKTASVRTITQPTCTTMSTTEHCYTQDPATMSDTQRDNLRREEKRQINKMDGLLKN